MLLCQEITVLPTTEAGNNNIYDLIVVGSGPARTRRPCTAKLRKKVAVVERKRTIGGVCVHTSTIPSKTFREAILYLSGLRQRTLLRTRIRVEGKRLGCRTWSFVPTR